MDGVRGSIHEARDVLDAFIADEANIDRISGVVTLMADCIRNGGKILAIGNGGSMCDAMHFCEELTGRFRTDREALPALACSDPSHLTCVANDFGFEAVFSRWVEAIGKEGDVLVALSTSGNSPNVVRAAERAVERGMTVVGLTGREGGTLARQHGGHLWKVPSDDSARIQEIHMLILHTLVQGIEASMGLGEGA